MKIWTVGHSNHELDAFVALLAQHRISALADVRSQPFSRRFPHFCKRPLQERLTAAGIRYVFLGDEFGARPTDSTCYTNGRADFTRMRASDRFLQGMTRLREGAASYRICLMCAERAPEDCHRTWLVAQALHETGADVEHVHADGAGESHTHLLRRLAGLCPNSPGLFGDDESVIAAVVREASQRVAYQPEDDEEQTT